MAVFNDSSSNSDSFIGSEENLSIVSANVAVGPPRKWDVFQIQPPDIDSGSMAARTWARRFEQLMLILALIIGFGVVFAGSVVTKGVTFYMLAQVSAMGRSLLEGSHTRLFCIIRFHPKLTGVCRFAITHLRQR